MSKTFEVKVFTFVRNYLFHLYENTSFLNEICISFDYFKKKNITLLIVLRIRFIIIQFEIIFIIIIVDEIVYFYNLQHTYHCITRYV